MKKLVVLLVLSTLHYGLFADSDIRSQKSHCENSPESALLNFGQPLDKWLNIYCDNIKKTHFIAPQKGYQWTLPNGKTDFKLSAYGLNQPKQKLGSVELNTYEAHKYHFVNSGFRALKEQSITNVNKMLQKHSKKVRTFKNILQLDVLSNTKNLYNLFFYIENDEPKWVLVCVNRCKLSVPIEINKK